MAFAAVFRAMGAAMPADFATVYAGEQPDPPPYPASFVPTYELWAPPESRLPMSYERHMIRKWGGPTPFRAGVKRRGTTRSPRSS